LEITWWNELSSIRWWCWCYKNPTIWFDFTWIEFDISCCINISGWSKKSFTLNISRSLNDSSDICSCIFNYLLLLLFSVYSSFFHWVSSIFMYNFLYLIIVKRNVCVEWTIILDGLSKRIVLKWNTLTNYVQN